MDYSRTAEHWDHQHFDKTFLRREWSFHPLAKARLSQLLAAPTREQWFQKRYLAGRQNLRGLGIGVGRAETELNLITLGNFAQYDLVDVSPAALADAGEKAAARGVAAITNIVCGDILSTEFQQENYHVITFIASLHHMERLHDVLELCQRLLVPGGIVWAAEYIGPDYFQFPDGHTVFAKALYRALDPALKLPGEPELKFPTREDVIAVDPTESIHSSLIVPSFRSVWPRFDFFGTYGTLMFIISWCMNHDAWYELPLGRETFLTLLEIDTAMIDAGRLPHYFAYLVARKDDKDYQLR